MALGFIKKVFSFGHKEAEERRRDEPLPPLNFGALETATRRRRAEPTPAEPPSPRKRLRPAGGARSAGPAPKIRPQRRPRSNRRREVPAAR